ncbi:MAG TPA: hypothetical protein DCM87_14755 [Planctomycetes bacterium]|nr:hypothetical protein [Planctomycetota bacterium]
MVSDASAVPRAARALARSSVPPRSKTPCSTTSPLNAIRTSSARRGCPQHGRAGSRRQGRHLGAPPRFRTDFMFRLTAEEFGNLRSQSATSSPWGGRRHPPYAFTEQGVAMLSRVLRSRRDVEVNIEIMRAFVRLREQSRARPPARRESDPAAGRLPRALSRAGGAIVATPRRGAPRRRRRLVRRPRGAVKRPSTAAGKTAPWTASDTAYEANAAGRTRTLPWGSAGRFRPTYTPRAVWYTGPFILEKRPRKGKGSRGIRRPHRFRADAALPRRPAGCFRGPRRAPSARARELLPPPGR